MTAEPLLAPESVAGAADPDARTRGRPSGVVVMAYGTPASLDDVEAYYTHIRRGRPPAPEQLEELTARYRALAPGADRSGSARGADRSGSARGADRSGSARGADRSGSGSTSPFRAITEAQTRRIGDALGDAFVVTLGQKHAPPFIEDAVATLADAGVARLVGVVLAPHYSRGSVGEYLARLQAAADEHGLPAAAVDSWHDLSEYLDFLADTVGKGLAALPARTKVLFTAHSLPERVLVGDRYPDELAASAAAVAERAGLDRWAGWGLAWQSAGRTPEPWRGPDVLEVLDDLADTGRADGVLVCPQGFVADHLEVLYDLDQQAASRAASLGLAFGRTRSLNDDAVVLSALAERVRALG